MNLLELLENIINIEIFTKDKNENKVKDYFEKEECLCKAVLEK